MYQMCKEYQHLSNAKFSTLHNSFSRVSFSLFCNVQVGSLKEKCLYICLQVSRNRVCEFLSLQAHNSCSVQNKQLTKNLCICVNYFKSFYFKLDWVLFENICTILKSFEHLLQGAYFRKCHRIQLCEHCIEQSAVKVVIIF